MIEEISTSTFCVSKGIAGSYCIGDSFQIGILVRPIWFHRLMVRIFFGWKWVDHK